METQFSVDFNFYRPQRSCEGYVFTRVCDSVHRGGCYPSMHCRWYPSMPCSRSLGGCLLQVGGGACSQGGLLPGGACSWGMPAPTGWGAACFGGGCLLPGGVCVWRPPQSRRLLLQMVCILLECILVDPSNHPLSQDLTWRNICGDYAARGVQHG